MANPLFDRAIALLAETRKEPDCYWTRARRARWENDVDELLADVEMLQSLVSGEEDAGGQ